MSGADWKEVARAMRENGLKQREIAEQLGRSVHAVRRVLMSEDRRARFLESQRREMAFFAVATDDDQFFDRHVPRVIRRLPGDPIGAARRFGAYEIDLEQLSRELWGRA